MDRVVLCECMYLAITRVFNRDSSICLGAREKLHLIKRELSGLPLLENKNKVYKCGLLFRRNISWKHQI